MRTFLLTFLGGLAALVVFFVLIPLVLIMSFVPSGEAPRARTAVLEIDLREGSVDQPAADHRTHLVFVDPAHHHQRFDACCPQQGQAGR